MKEKTEKLRCVSFDVPGEPQGKGRPRFSTAGGYARTYTPQQTATYENLVKTVYSLKHGQAHFGDDEQLCLRIDAYFAIPKSASRKRAAQMISGEIRPTKKPDADNILKIIADSLNGVAYKDDKQIVSARVERWYTADMPKVAVRIRCEEERK